MTKSWKDKVAHHEGLIRLIEPGNVYVCIVTNFNLFCCIYMIELYLKKPKQQQQLSQGREALASLRSST